MKRNLGIDMFCVERKLCVTVTVTRFLVLAILAFPSHFVFASSALVVSPRVEVLHVEFSASYSGQLQGVLFNNGYDQSLQALRFGLGFSSGDVYLDAYYQASNSGADSLLLGTQNLSYKSERAEYVVALGYRISNTLNVFSGYRQSLTDSEAENGNDLDIESDGYFIGASLNRQLSNSIVISVNGAYVYIKNVEYTAKLLGFPSVFDLNGSGNGWKLGASWNERLSNDWRYSIGVDYYHYRWDADNFSGDILEADEDELFLKFGIRYAF